jgi:hypothetical protein
VDIGLPVTPANRAPWQGQGNSFDFDQLLPPAPAGSPAPATNFAHVAGQTFAAVDKFLGQLGKPIGLKSYKPFHTGDEAFLQNYLGMIGLPMDMVPEFPQNEEIVLLTAQAAADPSIMDKVEARLRAGKKIVITSGFLRKMQGHGLERIAEVEDSGRVAAVKDYTVGWMPSHGENPSSSPRSRIAPTTRGNSFPPPPVTMAGRCCTTPTMAAGISTFSPSRKISPTFMKFPHRS